MSPLARVTEFVIRFDEGRRRWVACIGDSPVYADPKRDELESFVQSRLRILALDGYPSTLRVLSRKMDQEVSMTEFHAPSRFFRRK